MSDPLTPEQVMHIVENWQGNGGRRSLYSLCQEHNITSMQAYVILRSPTEMLKKARRGKFIYALDPTQLGGEEFSVQEV